MRPGTAGAAGAATGAPGGCRARPILAQAPRGSPRQLQAAVAPSSSRRGCRAQAASAGGGSGSGPFDKRQGDRDRDRGLLNALGSTDRAGSEYGEGFIQFRLSGERTHLDVDTLNEQMQIQGKQRIRHSMRPDEAFGLVFDWDGVVADTRCLQRAAWRAVAAAEGLPFPELERPQLYEMRPERAVTDVLMWTRDWGRAQELAWLVATEYGRQLLALDAPLPGVAEWLALMSKTRVPCALVTTMDRFTTGELLQKLRLRNYFSCIVTADDDMETVSQRYLSAAIKLGRPPNQCVVFAACPTSVTAAHNCTMKAVALLGTHKAFHLKAADLTCASMAQLSVYNIRRLFANRGAEAMDLRNKHVGKKPPQRRLTNATFDGDE